jgi:recombination protein RecR
MARFSPAIQKLIVELGRLPGIGGKSAQRLAFHLLAVEEPRALALAAAIEEARRSVRFCSICCNLTESDPCEICASTRRDQTMICVVENPRDVAAIERVHDYNGLYHVLHGVISPSDGIGPDKIRLADLIRRLQQHPEVEEIILATNPSVEGEATALYLARLLKPSGLKTTRLAHGIPMGGDLEFADEVTLARALAGRNEI